jgi:acylphosphatase
MADGVASGVSAGDLGDGGVDEARAGDPGRMGPRRRRLRAVVHGLVQGVGYRWFVQRLASRLELSGWVANRPDGSVEVVAEGDDDDLAHLLAALREGPTAAAVTRVDTFEEPATGHLAGFTIRSGAHTGD